MTFEELQGIHQKLQTEHSQVQAGYSQVLAENQTLKMQVEYLNFNINMLNRMLWGPRSEKSPREDTNGQEELFPDFPQKELDLPKKKTITYERTINKKKGHGRLALPDHLPVVERVIEPEGDITGLKRIGEEVTELLELDPARFYILRLIRPKYALADNEGVTIADMPSIPIPRGIPGPNLLSHICVGKYADHLPLARQLKQYARLGVELPPSTLNGWVNKGASSLIKPLCEVERKRISEKRYLMVDESPTKIMIKGNNKGKLHQGYFWLYYSPLDKEIFIDYQHGRSRSGPDEILKNFTGWLQTDGYSVYEHFGEKEGIKHIQCMAHARRYFHDLLKDHQDMRVKPILALIKKLYKVEADARKTSLDYAARRELRQEKSLTILKSIKTWLADQAKVLIEPSDPLLKAIAYMQNRWNALTAYTEDGILEIDNNLVENQVRPIPLGRKNWLFHGNEAAAVNAAMFYTVIGLANSAGINPQIYLREIFDRMWDHPHHKLEELLPQNIIIENT
jgi:transposase